MKMVNPGILTSTMVLVAMFFCAVFAQESNRTFTVVASPKGARRARMPHEQRREGMAVRGLVKIPFGKTASGVRTHLYRLMGQGGCVLDFTDYGARLVRAYVPDATGALVDIVAGAPTSVLGYEKAGDLSAVWKMYPIRRPPRNRHCLRAGGNEPYRRVGRADSVLSAARPRSVPT